MHHRRSQDSMTGRSCPKPNRRVQVIHAKTGSAAIWIGNSRFHTNRIPHLQMFHFTAEFRDDSGCFMSQYHRSPYDELSDRTVLIITNITTAYSHILDGNSDVFRTETLSDLDIPDDKFLCLFQYDGFHSYSSLNRLLQR